MSTALSTRQKDSEFDHFEHHRIVLTEAERLADGVTDPGRIAFADCANVAARFTLDELRHATASLLLHQSRERVRSAVLRIEREAERRASDQRERERESPAASTLYQGKYRHGVLNTRTGAAQRGCLCDECGRARADSEAIDERYANRLTDRLSAILREFKEECRIEWTAELLSSAFALGDGSTVTWGEATIAQHQQRIALLQRNAEGNLQAAARHGAAIDAITFAGASTLNEAAS